MFEEDHGAPVVTLIERFTPGKARTSLALPD
jgi:hypothetical protein